MTRKSNKLFIKLMLIAFVLIGIFISLVSIYNFREPFWLLNTIWILLIVAFFVFSVLGVSARFKTFYFRGYLKAPCEQNQSKYYKDMHAVALFFKKIGIWVEDYE